MSFDDWKRNRASGSVPASTSTPVSSGGFDSWKKKKKQGLVEPVDYEQFRTPPVKPAETPNSQLKPVDQIEHEMTTGEKLKSTALGYVRAGVSGIERIGSALKSTGKAWQQPTQEQEDPREALLNPVSTLVKKGIEATGIPGAIKSAVAPTLEKFGGKVEEVYGGTAKKISEDPAYKQEMATFRDNGGKYDPEKFKDPWVYLNIIAEGVGSFVPGAAVGLATRNPVSAGATMGLIEKGDAVQEYSRKLAESKGISVDELSAEDLKKVDTQANYYGAVSAVLESAFPGLLGRIMKGGGKNFLVETLKSIPAEGGTEAIQRFSQNLIAKVSEIDPNQVLSEGVLDEAIAGALTGTAVTAPISLLSPNTDTPSAAPVGVDDEPGVPGYQAKQDSTALLKAIQSEDFDTAEEIASKMSKKELVEARTILEGATGSKNLTEEQMERIQGMTEVLDDAIGQKDAAIRSEVARVAKGQAPETGSGLSIVDRAEAQKIVEKVKTALPPERQKVIDETMASLDVDRFDGVDAAQSLDNESSPFFEIETGEDLAQAYSEAARPLRKELNTLNAKKRELLAEKNAAGTAEEKKSIQLLIDGIDEDRRSYQADLKILEEQAGSKNIVLLQRTVDKIKALEPEFSLAKSVENDWNIDDYKKYLSGLEAKPENQAKIAAEKAPEPAEKPAPKASEKNEALYKKATEKASQAEATQSNEKPKVEPKPAASSTPEEETLVIDFQPFTIRRTLRNERGQFAGSTPGEKKSKPTTSRRRISKEEQEARDQMTDVIADALFNEDTWSRIITKTGEGMASFEDFAFLEDLKNEFEKPGKKMDFGDIREAYEVMARFGIPVSEALTSAFAVSPVVEKKSLAIEAGFARGIKDVKSMLLDRVKNKELKPRDYQEMSYALDLFAPLVKDMALSVGEKGDFANAEGMYDWVSNTISLFENTSSVKELKQNFYHEIGHHISRYIPSELLSPLQTKFIREQEEFFNNNEAFRRADKFSDQAKMEFYARHPDQYQYFDFDEWFAEMIRTKTTEQIQADLGVENESFVMKVVRYAKQLLAAMKEVVRRFRGEEIADQVFNLLKAGEELEVVSQLGLEKEMKKRRMEAGAIQNGLEKRRKVLYAAYERNLNTLTPIEALAFQRSFRKSVSESAIIEAVDILLQAGIKTSTFYPGARMVKKLPELKYGGAFVAPRYVDEYRAIVDAQAELIVQEKEIIDQKRTMKELGNILTDDEEKQLGNFRETLKEIRGKGKEVMANSDFEGIKSFLVLRGKTAAEVDRMFYSDEMSENDVLEKFREIILREDPGLLVGRKAAIEAGLVKGVENAKKNVESGKSIFSDQYKALEEEKQEIVKKSQEQFTEDDLQFINASNKLKAELEKLRRDKETQKVLREGSVLGKNVQRAKFALKIKTFRDRKQMVRYAKEFFGLSDAQFRKIGGNTSVQYLTDDQFQTFLTRIEKAAANESERNFLIETIYQTIKEKEIKKHNNLRKVFGFPTIQNMTIEQLREFSDAMDAAKKGDTFLTKRQIETVDNTELKGIRTLNEARERLAERMGVPVEQVSNLSADELDRFRYDTALAERNPFYQVLVDDTNREFLIAESRYNALRDQINKLIAKARKSRPRSILKRLIPTDELIFKYLESSNKASVAKDMTAAEIEAAEFIRETYVEVRDYLMSRKMMEKHRENYITHVRKRFLETWKDDGFLKAVKSVFEQYQEDEASFNILDGDTGNILPMEKFFQFTLARSGKIDPTQNVAAAFLSYMRTFEKKRAFDAIIPKMEIYTDALMNEKQTKNGLLFDRSLKSLVREWINNKKGRRSNLGGLVKQGGKLDLGMRFGNALVTMLDLGLSIPTGIASQVGEQSTNFIQMGAKNWTKGHTRMLTKKGRSIAEKYKEFTNENPWKHLAEASDNIGDTLTKSLFVLFADASFRANRQYLVGSLTDAEWKAGEIDPKRLAELKREIGRWRVVEGSESIIGSTSVGKVASKYRAWATPILRTTIKNIDTIRKNPAMAKTRAGQELLRSSLTISVALLAVFSLIGDEDKDEDEKSFIEKVIGKVVRDSLSSIQALDPTFWLGQPRLVDFLFDLSTGMKQLLLLERYKSTGEWGVKGSLKGDNTIRRALTPTLVRQFDVKD